MTTASANTFSRARILQLLASIGSAGNDPTRDIEAPEYDWRQSRYFNEKQMQILARYAASAARLISSRFAKLCQGDFSVTVGPVSQLFAGNFLDGGTSQGQAPGNYYLPFAAEKGPACGFVTIPLQTARLWTRRLLGETDSQPDPAGGLSSLEQSLLLDVACLIIEGLAETDRACRFSSAAAGICDCMPLDLRGTEQFIQITFSVADSADEQKSEVHVLILCENLAAVAEDRTAAQAQLKPDDIRRAMLTHINTTPVTLTANLATVNMTLEQIMSLAIDDILLLNKNIDEPINLTVKDCTIFNARCAKAAGNYAAVIEKIAHEESQIISLTEEN